MIKQTMPGKISRALQNSGKLVKITGTLKFWEVRRISVEQTARTQPEETVLQKLADFYTVFSDCTRVKVLFQLIDGEKCVSEIAEAVGISQSATSHQLRFLKQMAVVGNRRAGKSIYYRLIDDHIQTILKTGLEHVLEPEDAHDE